MAATATSAPAASFDALVLTAVRAGTPPAVAERARVVTASRFHLPRTASDISARARSYFWGVVRRRTLAGDAPQLATSMLALSLARELTEAGHPAASVRDEVARVYGAAGAGIVGSTAAVTAA